MNTVITVVAIICFTLLAIAVIGGCSIVAMYKLWAKQESQKTEKKDDDNAKSA